MLKTSEYFDGKVKSISLTTSQGPATVGVMEKGEYKFSTAKKEVMVVTSGSLKVKLPGKDTFKTILKDDSFQIDENSSFQVVAEEETSYICYYK